MSNGALSLNFTESVRTSWLVDERVSRAKMQPVLGEFSVPYACTANTASAPVTATCQESTGREHPNGCDSTRIGAPAIGTPSVDRRCPTTTIDELCSSRGGSPESAGAVCRWQAAKRTKLMSRIETAGFWALKELTGTLAMMDTPEHSTRRTSRYDAHATRGLDRA